MRDSELQSVSSREADAWSECLRRTRESGQRARLIDSREKAAHDRVRRSYAEYLALISRPVVFVNADTEAIHA